jgi:hypothetical protein
MFGCGVAATKRTVLRADMQYPERTRMTGYLADYTGWHEDTPGQVPRTAVMDEAFLESDGQRDCAVLTMRTFLDRDDALTQWQASLNGQQAYPEGEMVRVSDYTIHGERTVVDAVYATPFAAGSIQITQPTTDIWRVVERTARYCQPAAATFDLRLEYQKTSAEATSKLGFAWTLR